MIDLFKQKEDKPFSYTSIEMRKPPRGYYKWILLIIFIVVIFIILGSK